MLVKSQDYQNPMGAFNHLNKMEIYHYLVISAFIICFFACFIQLIHALNRKGDFDFSEPKGTTGSAISYSFTKAISPKKKETAFLHLPTYTAGILFHLGTFLCFFLLIIHLTGFNFSEKINYGIAIFLAVSAISIFSIYIKRLVNPKSRGMSNADDYFSNVLVMGFQVVSGLALLTENMIPALFIYASILFIYIPLGKLKHTVYFFAARIQLGRFYGFRGVWPPKNSNL